MSTYLRPYRGTFPIKRGDTQPGIEVLLPGWVDPLTSVGTIFVTERRTGVQHIAQPCVIVASGAEIVARYDWQAGDTDVDGIFDVEVEIALTGGGLTTVPDNSYIQMLIDADLGSGSPVSAGAMSAAGSGALAGVGSTAPATAGAMTSAGVGSLAGVGSTVPAASGAMTSSGVGSLAGVGSTVPAASGAMTSSGVGSLAGVGSTVPVASGAMTSAGVGSLAGVGSINVALGISDFSADRIIYDSRAAFGANSADVPLSGTGTNGQIVQARALSVDDAGVTSTAWADLATISGGVWSGVMPVPRSASWYRPEVRIKAAPAVSAQGANRFGVGHTIAIWGQSEHYYVGDTVYSNTTPPSVADPEAVQAYWANHASRTTINRYFITTGSPRTAALAEMANTLIAERPGDKFCLIFQTDPGTSPLEVANDGSTNRNWSDDLAMHTAATTDGRTVGVAAMSWFASPGFLGSDYAKALFPFISGKVLSDGSAQAIPGTVNYGSGTYHIDHALSDIYDYTKTKFVAYGPHRFDTQSNLQDALHVVGGGTYTGGQNKQECRDVWRALPSSPYATMVLANEGFEPLNYQNGYSDGAGGWTDGIHPGRYDADGMPAWAKLNAAAIIRAMGLTTWTVPVIDSVYWEPAGAYVEVGSSAGNITTTRLARSEAALNPATHAHWSEVMGFQINGATAINASIVAGKVRILPNSGVFTSSDVLTFGDGNGDGQLLWPDDPMNATWKNYPIVNVGNTGLTGIPLRPRPDASALTNTIVGGAAYFTTVSGQSTRFKDTANWPTTDGKITAAFDVAPDSVSVIQYLAQHDNTHMSLSIAANAGIYLTLKDSAGTTILSTTQIGTATAGVRIEVIVAADLATNQCWTTINGVTTARTLATNTGIFSSANRKFNFLSNAGGSNNFVIGKIYQLEVWNDCISGGGRPPTDALLRTNGRVLPPAATANAHPWKAGGNTV